MEGVASTNLKTQAGLAVRPEGAGRQAWIDLARGFGIVLVVIGHTERGLVSAGLLPEGGGVGFTDRWIYAFHMPLFFFLSGLHLDRRVARPLLTFLVELFRTVAYPYLVWSVLQTLLQALSGGASNRPIPLSDLWRIAYQPVLQFWFLYALFLIQAAYYLLRRSGLGPWAILTITLVMGFATMGMPFGGWWVGLSALMHFPYVVFGVLWERYALSQRLAVAFRSVILLAVVVAGFAAIGIVVILSGLELRPVPLLTALSGIAASIALALLLERLGGFSWLADLGRASLEIYVAHTIFSACVRTLLWRIAHIEDAWVHLVLGIFVGLYGPLALAKIAGRLNLEWLYRWRKANSTTKIPKSGPMIIAGD